MPGSSFPSTPSGLQSSPFLKGNEDFRLCHPFLKLLLPTPHQQFQVSWSLVLEDTQIWPQFLPTDPGEQGEEEPVDGGVLLGLGEAVPLPAPRPRKVGSCSQEGLPISTTHQYWYLGLQCHRKPEKASRRPQWHVRVKMWAVSGTAAQTSENKRAYLPLTAQTPSRWEHSSAPKLYPGSQAS